MGKDLKATVKVKAITYEGDDIFSLDTNYGTIKAKTLNPFSTDDEKIQKQKFIIISLNQAKKLRGALNTSAADMREIADRQMYGLPGYGWKYHEGKAKQLAEFGKMIDRKIKEL